MYMWLRCMSITSHLQFDILKDITVIQLARAAVASAPIFHDFTGRPPSSLLGSDCLFFTTYTTQIPGFDISTCLLAHMLPPSDLLSKFSLYFCKHQKNRSDREICKPWIGYRHFSVILLVRKLWVRPINPRCRLHPSQLVCFGTNRTRMVESHTTRAKPNSSLDPAGSRTVTLD